MQTVTQFSRDGQTLGASQTLAEGQWGRGETEEARGTQPGVKPKMETERKERGTDQLLPVLDGLEVLLFALVGLVLLLQVGLDGFVLGVEVTQVLKGRGKQ